MTAPRSPYTTTFHRDGTVTVWDVYRSGWTRTGRVEDRVLASLPERERARVLKHTGQEE